MTLCPPSTTYIRLQVVQRSLSGGYITEDEALLNANAPGKSYEALATTPGVRGLPVARAPRRGAALRSHKIRSRM